MLVVRSPRRRFHQRLALALTERLDLQAPSHLEVVQRMDVKLSRRTRPCPDVMVIDAEAATDYERRAGSRGRRLRPHGHPPRTAGRVRALPDRRGPRRTREVRVRTPRPGRRPWRRWEGPRRSA
nr:Uma2 family endonuclease [Microbispora sp. ATCC PTA-5024]